MFAPPNSSLFLQRILRRTSINQFGRVVVCVFNFEKEIYIPGLPDNNEKDLFINLWQRVWFFWQKGNSKKTFFRSSKRKSGISFSWISSLDIFIRHFQKLANKDGEVWYIPRHGGYNPHKPEKNRVLFVCNAKYKNESLNQNTLSGPDLTNTLIGVLSYYVDWDRCLLHLCVI